MKTTILVVVFCLTFSHSMAAEEHAAEHGVKIPVVDAAATTNREFGNLTVIAPIGRHFVAEASSFHAQERSVTFVGGGVRLPHLPKGLAVIPSVYKVLSTNEHDTAAIGLRFLAENRRIVADLNIIQSFNRNGGDNDSFVDPSHFSLRLPKGFQAGWGVEFFHHIPEAKTAAHGKDDHGQTRNVFVHGPRLAWERGHFQTFVLALHGTHGWEVKVGTAVLLNGKH